MWWILSGLLILIIWALEFILSFAVWIPILATALIVTFTLALFIFRFIQAQRSAAALEKAIAAQGAQQAMNARPERRAEIQALQQQVQSGIAALKTSKLGGKKGGASALYSLPWYMIIGPPGAGKTTAIKHSGLEFPFQGEGGGAVRGVGGTRNCDWWFTNEAIILDTAGRYATESDDRDEWLAFLAMLKKYRSRRPINGVLVAISIAELIDASEQQLEQSGKKLRARIDEVMTELRMVVPVYLVFTKCDLIAGFNEFFGNMRKTDRQQAWGGTLKLDLDKTQPGRIFDTEFEVLRKQIHARALKRLAEERNREAREKIYQFPLEFAGVKRNLSELVAATFAVNAFQGTPMFRGFYFTSGTQEGRPLDRVLGRMGQAMGIRPPEQVAQQVVESKSYFLHDVFKNIIFPDGSIAARSASEIRRQYVMRLAISAAAATLGVIVATPGVRSFMNNREMLRETETHVKAAEAINWSDHEPPSGKLDKLKPLLDRLEEIDKYKREGVPARLGWWMYQGDTIEGPAVAEYVKIFQTACVIPVRQKLESRLKLVKGEKYLADRTLLRTYLMLSDVEHLDVDESDYQSAESKGQDRTLVDGTEVGAITAVWAEILRPLSNIAESDLRAKIRPHVRYYLRLLKSKRVAPLAPNEGLVTTARKTLQSVPVAKRYYDFFVNSLIDEKYDEGGEDVRANRKYPPITLGDMFADRPDVLKILSSARFTKEKRWKEVEGPYSERGHYKVLKNIADGAGLLEREQWVVPLTAEEKGDRVPLNLKHLADDYEQRYVEQWTDWMTDIGVQTPATVKEAIELYATLGRPEWPYLRLFRNLEDHTQWKKQASVLENDEVRRRANEALNAGASNRAQGLRFNIDVKRIGERPSIVPSVFKRTVEFGIPTGSSTDTTLAKYISKLDALRGELVRQEDGRGGPTDPRLVADRMDEALKAAQDMLQPYDDKTRQLLTPLLTNPLKIVTAKLPPGGAQRTGVPGAGGARFQPPSGGAKFPGRR
ncbi:IcmF-related protein [Minicystis rosea]|nr:IcmF-related protein [Minicystis rosea]